MNQKPLFLAVTLVVLLAIGGAFWVMQKRQMVVNQNTQPEEVADKAGPKVEIFVTDVDPDISHWQTKEAEFFTIKFPKEWFWLENLVSGYKSQIITNTKNLDITEKYPDITFYDEGLEDRRDDELFITFYTMPTQEIDNSNLSTRQIINSTIRRAELMMEDKYRAICTMVGSEEVPILKCSRVDNGQTLLNYYLANRRVTTVVTIRKNEISGDDATLIDKIVQSLQLRNS